MSQIFPNEVLLELYSYFPTPELRQMLRTSRNAEEVRIIHTELDRRDPTVRTMINRLGQIEIREQAYNREQERKRREADRRGISVEDLELAEEIEKAFMELE